MAIQATDVSFVLSGGTNNDEPEFSLGGFPSPTPMPDTLNNLFTDITPAQASAGKVDYRCFYIFNDNADDPMYECTLFATPTISDPPTPTDVVIGILFRNEVQTISLTPQASGSLPPDSGSFRLKVDELQTDLITYSSDDTTLAANMETAFKAILENDVTITYESTVDDVRNFTVTFYGINRNKAFGVIEGEDNTIVPGHDIAAEKSVVGSPINTVAPDIGEENTAPNGISFVFPDDTGLLVGTLRANEGFPVWVKRTVPVLAESLDGDGITVKLRVKTSPTV
jgi:hypothetical protein